MKKLNLLTFALILASQQVNHAQNPSERDSLRAIVFDYKLHDTTRFQAGYDLISSFLYVMPDSIFNYAHILYEEAVKADHLLWMAQFKDAEGWYYLQTGKNSEALEYFLAALKLAEECDQPRLTANILRDIGGAYLQLGKFDKAGESLLRSIKLYREIGDLKALKAEIKAQGNLSAVYMNSGHHQNAIDACLRVITLIDSLKSSDMLSKAISLHYLGYLYSATGKPVEAISSYHAALQLEKESNYLSTYYITLQDMAFFLSQDSLSLYGKEIGDARKSIDIALAYMQELESWYRNKHDSLSLALCYAMETKAYYSKGERAKMLEKINEVEDLFLKLKIENPGKRHNLLIALSTIYEELGDYEKATKYYREQLDNVTEMNRVETAEKVSQLTESFEIEQMEGQLRMKEQELAKNRVITYLFIGISALILILAGVVFYFLRQKQRQNREIEKARFRAEQSEKFKERFLASMSHEIRTPLNAVIGMTGLLLDDPQPPRTETFLKNIQQAGEHLTGIINQVLDLSRIDAGKLELHEAPFSMKEMMEEMGNLLGNKAKEKDLQLIIHKGEGTPDWFYGDAGRILQVLLNLAGNAIKFTDRGSVQINMTADAPDEGVAKVTFSVEDTGVGISKDLQAVIFEEFVQAGQTEDQRMIGTGLGLSIARKLVERMGGTLSLESEPGKGSVFSFTIPLELSTEEAYQALDKEKDLSSLVMKGSFRILVVEDNPSNQIVTQGLLEKILPESGVILVEDGMKALALLEKEKFDLVLMDIRMPGIDGYETTRRLRQLKNENAAVPVIALTASVIRSDLEHCLEAGMNGYVPKPVSRTVLAKTLHDHLKIIAETGVLNVESSRENFLSGIADRPLWSDRLYDTCNGKKDRFITYLEAFLTQSEEETGKWQGWMDEHQHEPLAFSIHKLLPYMREFMDDQHISMAVVLDQELRKGWSESHSENILLLEEAIITLYGEASELLKAFR